MSELIFNKVAGLHPATVLRNFLEFVLAQLHWVTAFINSKMSINHFEVIFPAFPKSLHMNEQTDLQSQKYTRRFTRFGTIWIIKKTWKWPWRSVAFDKVADLSMQLYNTTLWVFFTLSKLCKWYQVSQSSTYIPEQPSWTLLCNCLWYWLCILNYPSRI